MKTNLEDLEDQIRAEYYQQYGEPSPTAERWANIAQRLHEQNHSRTRWQHWLQRFDASRVHSTATAWSVPVSQLVIAGSIMCILLLASGLVYRAKPFGSAHPAAMPASTASTVAANTLLAELLQSDPHPSIQQLAQNNQYAIDQTQSVSDDTVQIQKLQADANFIALGYTISGNTAIANKDGAFNPVITLLGGKTLSADTTTIKTQGPLLNGGTTLRPPIAAFALFDTPAIEGNPQQITLQIAIPVGQTSAHFTMNVPFSVGKTIVIHQQATASGQTLTVERAVITPFATRMYYTTSTTTPIFLWWSVTVAGMTYRSDLVNVGGSRTSSENNAAFLNDLQDALGSWTVLATAAIGQGSWQFTFSVA